MPAEPTLATQLAEEAAGRFLRYVRIDTQSDEESDTYPSTEKQLDLLRLLRDELEQAGLADATIDEYGYVTATLPATVEHDVPTIAYFAHADTAREVRGAASPQRIRYDGGEIRLGDSGQSIQPELSPELKNHVGHELITTDGTTLLGADDKAGVAEIMAAAARSRSRSIRTRRSARASRISPSRASAPRRPTPSTAPPPASSSRRPSRAHRCGCGSMAAQSTPAGRRTSS
jgi:di/tripeptidase